MSASEGVFLLTVTAGLALLLILPLALWALADAWAFLRECWPDDA